MSPRKAKMLSVLMFILMVAPVLVTNMYSVPKASETDHNSEHDELSETCGNPKSQDRGTRAVIEGTVLGEVFPQDLLVYPGYDYFTWGWEFEVNTDCTVIEIGAFWGDYPYDCINVRLWTSSGTLLLQAVPPIGLKDWKWVDTPDVTLTAGNTYILSAYVYTKNGSMVAVENPGPTADGAINPIKTVYVTYNGFPWYDYGSTPLPMVDIRYTYDFMPDITVPDDFATIQEAIDAANPGESVFVRNNPLPYEEELIISKNIDLIGEDHDTTIINASSVVAGSGSVVHITGSYVNVRGFTITGGDCGVFLDYTDNCTIRENIIADNNDCGIYMDNTNNDIISFNDIFTNNIDGDSEGYGIFAQDSHAKGVWYNHIHNNTIGVKLFNSWLWGCLNWNWIYDNEIGVDYDPEPLEIDGNMFQNNRIAIRIAGDDSPITISNNYIFGSEYGIYIEIGSPLIEANSFEQNTYAIYYVNDSSPVILNNTFTYNDIDIQHFIWAQIDIDPNTLNLKSKGRWMTCYVELPGDLDVNQIEISTLKTSQINEYSVDIPAESHPIDIEDYDGDAKIELMVKFDRSEVQDAVSLGENVIILTGQLVDGTDFGGSDSIVVKNSP